MSKPYIPALLSILAITSACVSSNARQNNQQMQGIIKSVSKPGVLSGIVATFVTIEVDVGQKDVLLLYPYIDAADIMPAVGSRCDISYEERSVEGFAADREFKGEIQRVAKNFNCRR